jgi:hypothetical protein
LFAFKRCKSPSFTTIKERKVRESSNQMLWQHIYQFILHTGLFFWGPMWHEFRFQRLSSFTQAEIATRSSFQSKDSDAKFDRERALYTLVPTQYIGILDKGDQKL